MKASNKLEPYIVFKIQDQADKDKKSQGVISEWLYKLYNNEFKRFNELDRVIDSYLIDFEKFKVAEAAEDET